MLPQPMEPLRVDLPVMAAADPPALQSGPMTFAERWSLRGSEAAATAPRLQARPLRSMCPRKRRGWRRPEKPSRQRRPNARAPATRDPIDRICGRFTSVSPSSRIPPATSPEGPGGRKSGGRIAEGLRDKRMDPDFREQLYHAGRAMTRAESGGRCWSAFRDDYRQRLAAGFKAHGGNSQHGGSNATGGYGLRRAIDITSAEGDSSAIWHWIAPMGRSSGGAGPCPSADRRMSSRETPSMTLLIRLREARSEAWRTTSAEPQPLQQARPRLRHRWTRARAAAPAVTPGPDGAKSGIVARV